MPDNCMKKQINSKQNARRIIGLLCISLLCFTLLPAQNKTNKSFTDYVNPFIGSSDHGHVFVGANVPFGMVQAGPSNIMQTWDKFNGWDWCSGYNYASKEILGFTHTHLSGTGIGDLNDILILPANGKLQTEKMKFEDENSGYGSSFSHEKEICRPGYYKVCLDKYKITAELTATERTAFHQYKFDNTDNAHLLVDLAFGMGWDAPVNTSFTQVNDTVFTGFRFSKGWAHDQRVFFAIKLSQPVTALQLFDSTASVSGSNAEGKYIKAALFFNAAKNPLLKIKIGLSPVSAENALANIAAEIPHWDFEKTKKSADTKWHKELEKIKITAGEQIKTIFYTALYHAAFFPCLYNDNNGAYLGTDKKEYSNPGFANYTLFSLWDTYRGFHPLATLIQPDKVNDYIQSFLAIYKQQGKLPVWHFYGNETNTMIGYPAVPVIADAILKGFKGFDINLAYEAMKQSAMQQTDGINYIQRLQFIPADSIGESVAKAQEYAIADGAIALVAKYLGKKDDYDYFSKRAQLYKLYFDKTTGFMRGRLAATEWRTPFSPFNASHRQNDYCEGNGWQYTWLVPQDVKGLIQLFGGDKLFTQKLDSLFNAPSALGNEASPDISGMIGQYAHGNEPDHHITYLYSYAGQPWKTAALIRKITDTFYTAKTNGLCGNDDMGEMSAWYVLSALGFYPVNPASGDYVFGSPLVSSAVITTGEKKFSIRAVNNSATNIYIQKATLNGKPYTKSFLSHSDIVKGGDLVLYMGSKPSAIWGAAYGARPQ